MTVASSPYPSPAEVPVSPSIAHDLLILLVILQLIVLNVWWTRHGQLIGLKSYRASATASPPADTQRLSALSRRGRDTASGAGSGGRTVCAAKEPARAQETN
jgi:hypothetical protein